MTVSKGWETKIGIGIETDAGTAVTPTLGLEVNAETFDLVAGHEEFDGMFGSRAANQKSDVLTTLAPREGWTQMVKANEIGTILRLITGDTASPYVLRNSVPSFTARRDVGPKHERHAGCKVNTATFEASQDDQILKCTLEAVGMTQDFVVDGTSVIPAADATHGPLLFRMLTLEVADSAFHPTHFRCAFANGLLDDIFRNSQTRLEVPEGPVTIEGEIAVDWHTDSHAALYAQFLAGTFAKLEAIFSDGTDTVEFEFAHIKFTEGPVRVERDGAVLLTLPWRAKESGAGAGDLFAVTVTNA